MSLLNELRNWRNNQARIEGVEQYRVLSNATLEALVGTMPQNKEEMLLVKGIKEAKYGKYGAILLKMIRPYAGNDSARENVLVSQSESRISNLESGVVMDGEIFQDSNIQNQDSTLTVSAFLDGLNIELSGMAARVQGEVSSVDVRERVVYFTIKDSQDESMLSCLIFRNQYTLSGVDLAIGDEIIVEGAPDIYKPSGRLSFRAGLIEPCGQGALKKA